MARIEAGINFGEAAQKLETSLKYRHAVQKAFPFEPEFHAPFKMLAILARDMGVTTREFVEAVGDRELFLRIVRRRDALIQARPLESYPDFPGAKSPVF